MKLTRSSAAVVTAAFLGPGTLTTCTVAGASYGYNLLWVLALAIIMTIVLQEMSLRLAVISGKGLGNAIRGFFQNRVVRWIAIGLVFLAIIFGNAAYEMGNLLGATLAFNNDTFIIPIILAILVFIFLWFNNLKSIQLGMSLLVAIMGLVFLSSAIMTTDDWRVALSGFIPHTPKGSQMSLIALMGTTIVPYNLFLHASTMASKNLNSNNLKQARWENILVIGFGGIVSMAVLIAAANTSSGEVFSVQDIAKSLQSTLGSFSTPFISVGLFAAGLSSAITAPLAAAYTAKEIFDWKENEVIKSRLVWLLVLLSGLAFTLMGLKPIPAIRLAQVANAVVLPCIVIFLLILCNQKYIMHEQTNNLWQNLVGGLILLATFFIAFRGFNAVFQFV